MLLLLHGIAGSARTWDPLLAELERLEYPGRVLAPDLLGHGELAQPHGDYSMGAYASDVRDLLVLLELWHATVIGHSLGGGIAMQFAYQFPQHCGRLVLVSSGGLGRTVSPLLRAATLPGAKLVLPLLASRAVIEGGRRIGQLVERFGGGPLSPELTEFGAHFASLEQAVRREAFVDTARGVIDVHGQRVSGRDRLYLADAAPTLLVWGEQDPMIPVEHGRRAAREMPGSRLEVFEESGHFPHCAEPERFASVLLDFLATTSPARLDVTELAQKLAE
ncbi:pimeloyl-ACP methyl ester carboxylesterase [Kutzneria viridogrisea]|uniref:Pimeloyl-ACP methyl ester carboxylesterase n=1 Tax=Kutzneria viridogrisea TaxID=47990 RepID=A0ABR6BD89_9PSEU|nr:alpha/beta hydrolase [Kutzneria albida]MBA8924838.1 pimeloyl-ACP methyl ester carboxylesterase [Kutzneria viridogrisea]